MGTIWLLWYLSMCILSIVLASFGIPDLLIVILVSTVIYCGLVAGIYYSCKKNYNIPGMKTLCEYTSY